MSNQLSSIKEADAKKYLLYKGYTAKQARDTWDNEVVINASLIPDIVQSDLYKIAEPFKSAFLAEREIRGKANELEKMKAELTRLQIGDLKRKTKYAIIGFSTGAIVTNLKEISALLSKWLHI